MSKKKRQFRERSVASGKTTPSVMLDHKANKQIDDVSQSNAKPSGFGLLRCLKTHWWVVSLIGFLSLGALGAGLKYLEEDAREQMLNEKLKTESSQSQSLLNSVNPFLPAALPDPTPELSKEYIYAGDRLLAVEDANATAIPPSDVAVWRPDTGWWFVRGPDGNIKASQQWGLDIYDDKPKPGDYDGDGKTDFCVVRPSEENLLPTVNKGTWYILYSSTGVISGFDWAKRDDIPVQADYDGDGKTDIAVVNTTDYQVDGAYKYFWLVHRSSDQQLDTGAFGNITDKPAPADYDGDGKADRAVWRDSTKSFYWLKSSSNNEFQTVSFADQSKFQLSQNASPEVISADYDGDGKDDFAVRDGVYWVILKSSDGMVKRTDWGITTDRVVQNDYDGDGKVDIAVWRPNGGNWYIKQSSQNDALLSIQWGQLGDEPVPVFYRR